MAEFLGIMSPSYFGAGFKKDGVDISNHTNLITFDGQSVYFFGLSEREASGLLDGVTMLSGYKGWLAYILQELFYDETIGEDLYGEIFDGLYSGAIKGPPDLSVDSIYRWVENVADEVESVIERLKAASE
ncbi:MAG: hypothetical protein ACOY31_13190 [Bacillota bacterium]